MKQTYSTPGLVLNGHVVSETKNFVSGRTEPAGFLKIGGDLGFNL